MLTFISCKNDFSPIQQMLSNGESLAATAISLFNRYATRDASASEKASAFPTILNKSSSGGGSGGSSDAQTRYETFVISMNEDSPRWQAVQYRLDRAGFAQNAFRRWPAVDGKALALDSDAAKIIHPRVLFALNNNPVCLHDVETWGTIGCYLSHWSIWQYVVKNHLSAVIVFEDDAVPRIDIVGEEFPETIESLIREAGGTNQFDFMRFEWIDLGGAIRQRVSTNLFRSRGLVVNMCAYVVTNRGAQRLLRRALPVSDPIDMLLTYTERTDDDFVSLLSRRILTVQDRKNFDSQVATEEERRDRKESFCQRESNVLGDTRPGKGGTAADFAMWIAIGALALFLVAAIIVIVVLSRKLKERDEKRQKEEKGERGEEERDLAYLAQQTE